MKIDRSYGNYEKESYKPTPTVDAPTVKAAQSTVELATIKLSDTAQKIRQTHPAETKNAEKSTQLIDTFSPPQYNDNIGK